MMIGALMIHGIAPGPRVMTDRPGLFWGLIASMWLGNLMLVILNLPMVGVWVRLLRGAVSAALSRRSSCSAASAPTRSTASRSIAYVMAFFAIFGYVALKLDCEPAPLILGFVLGPMMEENLRRALLISRGDPMVFVQEPISLAFLLVAAGLLSCSPRRRSGRSARRRCRSRADQRISAGRSGSMELRDLAWIVAHGSRPKSSHGSKLRGGATIGASG